MIKSLGLFMSYGSGQVHAHTRDITPGCLAWLIHLGFLCQLDTNTFPGTFFKCQCKLSPVGFAAIALQL